MFDVEASEALLESDPSSLDDEALGAHMLAVLALVDRAQAAALAAIGEFDARALWAGSGALNAGQFLARAAELPAREARVLAAVAKSLRHTTLVAPALAAGEVGVWKARALAKVRTERTAELFDDHEATLLAEAQRLSVDDTIRLANHWHHMADTDGAAPDDADQSARLSPLYDGRWRLDANLNPEGGAVFAKVLDQIMDDLFRSSQNDGVAARGVANLRADALVEMARRASAARDDAPAARPLIVVRVDLSDLERRAGWPATTENGYPLSWETMNRLLCDADVCRVVTDGPSRVVDVGRDERTATQAQRRALLIRDAGCVFPGCDRPPGWCQAHHIVWWEHGGTTDLTNLCLLCHRHHVAVHKGLFTITRDQQGQLVFTHANGVVVEHDPILGRRYRWPAFSDAATS